jgi:hypothetical protein
MELLTGSLRIIVTQCLPTVPHQDLESPGIYLVGLNREKVAGPTGQQHPVAERFTQTTNMDMEGVPRLLWWALGPELVDQPIGGHDLSALQSEKSDNGTLQTTTQFDSSTVASD